MAKRSTAEPAPPSTSGSGRTKAPNQRESARARLAAERQREEQRRKRMFWVALPLAVVLVVVGTFVAVRFAKPGSSVSSPSPGAAPETVVSKVTNVPPPVLDQVGGGNTTSAPKSLNAPPLTQDGKPKILYVGAEYCPYCAAERWSMVVALSRFGTFSNLGQAASSTERGEAYPGTATLSFHGSSYTSSTIAFTGVETAGGVVGGRAQPLDTLSAEDQKTLDTYNQPPYVPANSAGSIPFADIGGKYLISGASYDAGVLAGKTHQEIADALSDPTSPIAQAVDGAANQITAAICASTGNAPADVCNSPGVRAGAQKLS